jgi:hypothetical protein
MAAVSSHSVGSGPAWVRRSRPIKKATVQAYPPKAQISALPIGPGRVSTSIRISSPTRKSAPADVKQRHGPRLVGRCTNGPTDKQTRPHNTVAKKTIPPQVSGAERYTAERTARTVPNATGRPIRAETAARIEAGIRLVPPRPGRGALRQHHTPTSKPGTAAAATSSAHRQQGCPAGVTGTGQAPAEIRSSSFTPSNSPP